MFNKSECILKSPAYPTDYPLFWMFKGIPFNIILNVIGLSVCLLWFLIWRCLVKALRKQGLHIPSVEDEVANKSVPLNWRDIFWTSNQTYVERAGYDALIYMHSTQMTLIQSSVLLIPFVVGLIHYPNESTTDEFDRISLSSFYVYKNSINYILLATYSITVIFYLALTGLRYSYAFAASVPESKLKRSSQYSQANQVLMLTGVRNQSGTEVRKVLEDYFSSFVPPVIVRWIQPVLNLTHLTSLQQKRETIQTYLSMAQAEQIQTGREPSYKGLCCRCTPAPVSALQVYSNKLARLNQRINAEMVHLEFDTLGQSDEAQINAKLSGVVFVGITIECIGQSNIVQQSGWLKRFTASSGYRVPFEQLRLAPHPSDLYWLNLMDGHYRTCRWWTNRIVITIVAFMLALLLTTPTYVLYLIHYFGIINWLNSKQTVLSFQWLPSLALAFSAMLVRQLITHSEDWTKHATRNGREKVGMRTLYAFLLLTVLVFPSLGMAGLPYAAAHVANLFKMGQLSLEQILTTLQAKCVLVPDTSALFVNYVITSALLGGGFQLLQPGRWFWFMWIRLCHIHSTVEAKHLAENLRNPFEFPAHYALVALVQTIVVAYAPVCPLIVPFGYFYLITKLLVDKYALLRIHSAPGSQLQNALGSVNQPPGHKHIGHMAWFVQATHFSLVGICLFAVNLTAFYLSYAHVDELRSMHVAYPIMTFGTIFWSIMLSIWGCRKWMKYAQRFGSLVIVHEKQNDVNRSTDDLTAQSVDLSPEFQDYTVPVLLNLRLYSQQE